MVDILDKLIKDITDWLKFAEAKNGVLITFNSGILLAIVKIISDNKDFILNSTSFCMRIILSFALFLMLILPSIVCLFSFRASIDELPFIEKHFKKKLANPTDNDNLLFYLHITNYYEKRELYYDKVKKLSKTPLDEENYNEKSYSFYLINQVIELSVVTFRKYYLFNVALTIEIWAFLMSLILFVLA